MGGDGGGEGGEGARLGGSTDESGARPRLQHSRSMPPAFGQQSPESPRVAQPVYAEQAPFDGAALLAGPTGESGAGPRAQQPSAMPAAVGQQSPDSPREAQPL